MEEIDFVVHAVQYEQGRIAGYKVRPAMKDVIGEFSMEGSRIWLAHYLDKGEPRFFILADEMGKEGRGAEISLNANGFIRTDGSDEECDWLGDLQVY